ncbi:MULTISPECIES: YEATS-associated helix-containing protein [unclassified Chryseobacterium]|uniref:YEATS-associated helix-containing protein n=1 Tax=unclassified Chryseobacterium TaxID=2593645 RepID=UPI003017522A
MELSIMLLIMLATGIVGGCVNYLLPSNRKQDGTLELSFLRSIVLGIGATLLVPIFLNTVDSQLMDDIKLCSEKTQEKRINLGNEKQKQQISIPIKKAHSDSPNVITTNVVSLRKDSLSTKDSVKSQKNTINKSVDIVQPSKDSDHNAGKKYLLWGAYCALAAIAGFKFIELIIKNVLRAEEVRILRHENLEKEKELDKTKEEKEKKEKELQKRKKLSTANLVESEAVVKNDIESNFNTKEIYKHSNEKTVDYFPKIFVMPALPGITNLDDPQKGRFGGKSEVNNRKLSATVTESRLSGFFNVSLKVSSADANNPIISETYFYLHDTFLNPVRKVLPINGEVVLEDLLSYGAFTVGVITDFGETILELDLSEGNFPKKFKES